MPEKQTILVIDDERELTRGLGVRLRAAGFDVLTAGDGVTGVGMASQALPDAILLDVRMPGMDGFEVLSELGKRAETHDIPVIVLSANVVEQTRSRAVALGARRFMEKPFQPEKLLSAIRTTLGREHALQNAGAL